MSALALRGIRVDLPGRSVLDGLNLEIEAGECRALVGLNGAGKTTALRVALGMLRPTAGEAQVLGENSTGGSRRIWGRVGHLVEVPFSYPELTAAQNIEASARLHGAGKRRSGQVASRMAEALGLAPWMDTPVRRLSLGTRQKVGLIAALAHEPDLVVLDEPTNGLDPLAVVAFRALLEEVTARGGAICITSHHIDELARVADRVDILHAGRVLDSLVPDGSDLEHRVFDTVLAAEVEARSLVGGA